MKSKHTKNKCYHKEIKENWEMTKFIESPAVKKLCELTKESGTLLGWLMAGTYPYVLEASEVEGMWRCEGSETRPWLRVRRFPHLRLLLLSNRYRPLLQKRDQLTASWFRLRISEDGQKAELLWDSKMEETNLEFASHLMSHMERLKVNPNHKVVFHCHPTNLIALSFTQPLDERHL